METIVLGTKKSFFFQIDTGTHVTISGRSPSWIITIRGSDESTPMKDCNPVLLNRIRLALTNAQDVENLSNVFYRDLDLYLAFTEQKEPFPPVEYEQFSPGKAERRALLTEECSEVIQSVQKMVRFGEKNRWADEKVNLEKECGDILVAMSLMILSEDIDLLQIYRAAQAKLRKFKDDHSLMSKQDPALLRNAFLVFESRVENIKHIKKIIKEGI